jgi:excisionase family DNA binding protein
MARRVQEGSSEGEIPDPLEGKLLLSVREVAKALGVSRMTVYRLVKQGKLKLVYPTPRSSRVTRESLLAFLRSLEEGERKGEGTGKGALDRAREVLRRFGL